MGFPVSAGPVQYPASQSMKKCPICGKDVRPRYGGRESVYCSRACLKAHYDAAWETITCPVCGKEFRAKNSSGGSIALILARMLARRGGKSRQKPSGKLASTGEFPAPGSTPGRGNLKQIAMQRYGCWNPRMGRKSRPGISSST